MAFIYDRSFGCLSGLLGYENEQDRFIVIELEGKGKQQVSSIVAQYGKTGSADVSTIIAGRLLVFREQFKKLILENTDPFGLNESDAILDVNINSFEPLYLDFSGRLLESATDGNLTIVLLAPIKTDNSLTVGRLNVLGNTDQQLLKGVKF